MVRNVRRWPVLLRTMKRTLRTLVLLLEIDRGLVRFKFFFLMSYNMFVCLFSGKKIQPFRDVGT